MIETHAYIGLTTLTMDACTQTKEDYAKATRTWLCTGCCSPKATERHIDVAIQRQRIDKPLNVVFGCGVTLAYRPFLELFPKEIVERDFYVGQVLTSDQGTVKNWVTIHGRKRIIIRGSEHAGTRICEQCGRDVYFAMGKKYLYPQPHDEAAIYERSGGGGIVLHRDLFSAIEFGNWPKLDVDELPVIDPPLDGLGILTD